MVARRRVRRRGDHGGICAGEHRGPRPPRIAAAAGARPRRGRAGRVGRGDCAPVGAARAQHGHENAKDTGDERRPVMVQRGHFVLHSNVLPPVTAGKYTLVGGQTGLPFQVEEQHTHVTVSSPRFTMPPEQVLSTFPPANGEGAYGDRLPQIVLKRRTLPWERNPAEAIPVSPTPWLALVVVAEGEGQLSTPTPLQDCGTPGATLLDPGDRGAAGGFSPAVPQPVVEKFSPTREALPLLVHVREVDVQD